MLTLSFWTQVLAGGLRLGVPVGLASLGELVGETAGILNLGIEGQMALGAAIGFAAAAGASSVYLGLIVGLLVGAALGAGFASLVIGLRANQVVVGFALALGGEGLADFIYTSAYKSSAAVTIQPLGSVSIPGLSQIPFLGQVLFQQAPLLVWFLPILALAVALMLRYTRLGLEIRACGHGPVEATARGVPVHRIRYSTLVFGGALAGLAGALLSVGIVGSYNVGLINGRGFVAVALVIASGWRPSWLLGAALLFGGLQAFDLYIQTISTSLPIDLLNVAPYAIPLIALAFGFRSRLAPTALGQAFIEE